MIFPSFDDPFGKKKLGERPPVKAPADLNWDAIEARIRQRKQPTSTGEPRYDSSGYLARMRQEDPWPTKDDKSVVTVSLSNCRFLNPEELVPDEVCTVACDVKILSAPSSRNVLFQLFLQVTGNKGWEEAGSLGNVSMKSSPVDQTVQVNFLLRSPDRRPELGSTVHFKVTAHHNEASGPVESPDTPVQMRNLCRYVGTSEIKFRKDGDCPTLEKSGGLVHALAAAVGRLSMKPPEGQSPDSVVIAGFASSSGTPGHDRDLSQRRAQSIKALLGRDADGWAKLAAKFKTEDIQQILSGLASGFGWPCDPGAVDGEDGPATQAGVKSFQAECNTRYSQELDEDGVCGPKSWGAVHRAISALVAEAIGQDPSAEPSWPDVPWGFRDGGGVYACGSDFAAADDSASDRHVEICFFESNMRPPMAAPAPGEKATLADYPVEDPGKIVKKCMVVASTPEVPSSRVPRLPLYDKLYHDHHHMPNLIDDEFMEVMAGLLEYKKANGTCAIDIHPDAPTDARELLDRRKRLAESIVHNDSDAWADLTGDATITDVQSFLKYFASKNWPCDPGPVDGVIGPITQEAVRDFQCLCNETWRMSLKMDGIFGPKTWQAALHTLRELIDPGSAKPTSSAPSVHIQEKVEGS